MLILAFKECITFCKTLIFLKLVTMLVDKSSQHLKKRYPYYYSGDNGWYRYRWLLWLLVLIPCIIVAILWIIRSRRAKRPVTYDNNQYYQTQQVGGYPNQTYPDYYQGQEAYYGNQPASVPPQEVNYSRPEGPPPQYTGQAYQDETFARPEGPPPTHPKA